MKNSQTPQSTMTKKSRALILDPTHRCLLAKNNIEAKVSYDLPHIIYPGGLRPLPLLKGIFLEEVGVSLSAPCGQYPLEKGLPPQDFAFLIGREKQGPGETLLTFPQYSADQGPPPSPSQGPSYIWVPLKAIHQVLKDQEHLQAFWDFYLTSMLGGYRPPSLDLDVFSFGNNENMAARLAHLVIKGHKRATAGLCAAMEASGLQIPSQGTISLVTDGWGIPLCCIETVKVTFLPFHEVTADMARLEGEGDMSLEDWIQGHKSYFTQEAAHLHIEFNEQSLIFFEEFKVLKVFGQAPSIGD